MTANQTWAYLANPAIWSPICSSVYEDGNSYLIDYASADGGPQILGIDDKGKLAFHYQYQGWFGLAWNSAPIHLEDLKFTKPVVFVGRSGLSLTPSASLPRLNDLM